VPVKEGMNILIGGVKMALLWFDGFESYEAGTDIAALSPLLSQYSTVIGAYGRRGGNAIFMNGINDWHMVKVSGTPATIVCGFAIYLPSETTPVYSPTAIWIRLDDASEGGNTHLKFYINGSRLIEVRNNALTLLGTTSGHTIDGNTWYYIEIKATISDTVGQITINVDEVERLSTMADKDTLNGSNAYVGGVKLGGVNGPTAIYYDDLYILDDSGTKNNDFLGDVRVDVLRPNGAGTYTDFTPSAGSNYENVDEAFGPDDDTTYNDGSTVADQDSYALENLPAPAGTTIYGVKSQITVRKTDAGSRECKLLTRAGTTDDLGDTIILSDSFTTHTKIFEDNPDDSADWEDADVNGMEVGVEITV